MNQPTLKQLRYFLALTEEQHFGRAAEACFVSQSAFSSAIKELESTLGVQLVDRNNRNVTISAIGQDVAVQARLVMRDLEGLVELTQGQTEPLGGELRLGVIPTIAPFMLPKTLPRLRRTYPDLRLYLVEDQTQRIYERLLAGELDVLLLALPWPLRNVETRELFRDRFCRAYRAGSEEQSILLLEDGHCLRDHALDACRIRNSNRIQRFGASSLLTLIEMVDADLATTYLPEMAKGSALMKNTRVQLDPPDDKSYRMIGLAWRKGSRRVDEFALLGQSLVECFNG